MNRIAVFENDKGENPKRPDFRAVFEIDGQQYKASLWWNEKEGKKWLGGPVEKVINTVDNVEQDQGLPF